jgi:hypothetical protein
MFIYNERKDNVHRNIFIILFVLILLRISALVVVQQKVVFKTITFDKINNSRYQQHVRISD